MLFFIHIMILIILIFLLFKYGDIKHTHQVERSALLLAFVLLLPGDNFNTRHIILYLALFGYIIYRRFRNVAYKIDAYNDIDYLNREVDTKYNPSIIGFLVNMKIDLYNLSADIVNLYEKKIIDIENINQENTDEKYKLKLGENYGKEEVCESDKYIIDSIIINRDRAFYGFEFKEWEELVKTEYRSLGLIKENFVNYASLIAIAIMVIFSLGIGILLCVAGIPALGIAISILLLILSKALYRPIVMFLVMINDSVLSEQGKEEFKKWVKFKKFMQEYTLIEDKKIKDVAIYEKYVAYSIALGIVDDHEEIVEKVFRDSKLKLIKKDVYGTDYNKYRFRIR